jgi:hypothetical protein
MPEEDEKRRGLVPQNLKLFNRKQGSGGYGNPSYQTFLNKPRFLPLSGIGMTLFCVLLKKCCKLNQRIIHFVMLNKCDCEAFRQESISAGIERGGCENLPFQTFLSKPRFLPLSGIGMTLFYVSFKKVLRAGLENHSFVIPDNKEKSRPRQPDKRVDEYSLTKEIASLVFNELAKTGILSLYKLR